MAGVNNQARARAMRAPKGPGISVAEQQNRLAQSVQENLNQPDIFGKYMTPNFSPSGSFQGYSQNGSSAYQLPGTTQAPPKSANPPDMENMPGIRPSTPSTGGGLTAGQPSSGSPSSGLPSYPSNQGPYGQAPDLPGMFSQGGLQQQAPMLSEYGYQQGQAPGMLSDVYDRATNGTIQSYNTSANRLRERLDSQTKGLSNQATSKNLARGFGNSGSQGADQFRVQAAGQNAYAQGLNELSNTFEQNRLQGLQTALGAGNSMREGNEAYNSLMQKENSERRNLGNSNFQQSQQLDTQNRNFMDQTLFGLLNSREQRGSNERMQQNQNQFEGGENDQERQLREMLQQLQEQNANFRTSLGGGFNQSPTLVNAPGLNQTLNSGPSYGTGYGVNTNNNYGLTPTRGLGGGNW